MKRIFLTAICLLCVCMSVTGCKSTENNSSEQSVSSSGAESQHVTAPKEEVGFEGMTAISGDSLKEDPITNSKSYDDLFMGTGEQALADGGDNFISYTVNGDDQSVFTVTVEALDKEIQCAALSAKKQEWYDRTLVFRADSLPDEAFTESRYNTVQSPAKLMVKDNTATAEIIFSSDKYDYMIVNGEKYLPVIADEKAIFEIPVIGFDYKMPVSADTTAMSQPYEIEYTLYFDSETIK